MTKKEIAADILDTACMILMRDGWCQFNSTNNEGNHCAIGAISLAWREERVLPYSSYGIASDAVDLLVGESITRWNDQPGRTRDEVIKILHGAAAALRASKAR